MSSRMSACRCSSIRRSRHVRDGLCSQRRLSTDFTRRVWTTTPVASPFPSAGAVLTNPLNIGSPRLRGLRERPGRRHPQIGMRTHAHVRLRKARHFIFRYGCHDGWNSEIARDV